MIRRKKTLSFLVILFSIGIIRPAFSQSNEEIKDTISSVKSAPVPPKEDVQDTAHQAKPNLLPELGFGPGLMTFFGDYPIRKTGQPIRYRIGYNFLVQKTVLPFLELSGNVLTGNLYGNQRGTSGNTNFQSKTLAIGLSVIYNFNKPFYSKAKKPPLITPYVGAGIEYLSFNTKTDILDKKGNPYHYWHDGSIHDVDETDPGSIYAQNSYRDYSYETPVIKGTSFGFPVTAGIKFHVSERISLNIGSTYHLTQSDKIDNIVAGKKDNFLFSYTTLLFNFGASPYKNLYEGGDLYADVDFSVLDKDDTDGDGVKDLADNCPGTPAGAQVDEKGCPLDDDKDGVPNYADLEANTPLGALVDEKGVQITDEYIEKKNKEEEEFLKGGATPEIVNSISFSDDSTMGGKIYFDQANKQGVSFKVQMGSFKNGIPSDQVESFMRVQDISTFVDKDGNTVYTAGVYGNKLAAQSRRDELKKSGVKDPKVIAMDQNGNLVDPNSIADYYGIGLSGSASYEIIFKVQVGAFSQKVPADKFSGVQGLSKEPGPNGLTRYLGGSFHNYAEAVTYQNILRGKGYDGAFVVAYKDGKRVGLGQVKGEMPKPEAPEKPVVDMKPVFKVQIGIFKADVTGDLQKLYASFKNLEKTETPNGLKKYTAGAFSSYEEALKYKEEVISKGINGAFVTAFINGKQVSLSEAMKAVK